VGPRRSCSFDSEHHPRDAGVPTSLRLQGRRSSISSKAAARPTAAPKHGPRQDASPGSSITASALWVQDAVFGAQFGQSRVRLDSCLCSSSYTDERALLLGIPKKYPRVDSGEPVRTAPSASATGRAAPTVSEAASSSPVVRRRGRWYRIVTWFKRWAGTFGTH
jgi:hypothetical protein